MKPMQVDAGQYAPDVDELVEKAGSMIEKLEMDNSQIRNITGVEEAPMNHYYTNQQLPESSPEEVTNKGASSENVSFINANPHQTGSTLDSHENPSGGDPHPPSSYTHSSVGKPPSDVKKQIEAILKRSCPSCGTECSSGVCKNVACSVEKAGNPLEALLGGGDKGGPDMPPPEGGPDDMPLGDDEPSDPESLAAKIHDLVDELKDKAGMGDDKPPMGDEMTAGPTGTPPMPPGPM
tara:strand:- start:456 stop:1163 length:708 start_codon:yes stop_codon:yes gene_type:complete